MSKVISVTLGRKLGNKPAGTELKVDEVKAKMLKNHGYLDPSPPRHEDIYPIVRRTDLSGVSAVRKSAPDESEE